MAEGIRVLKAIEDREVKRLFHGTNSITAQKIMEYGIFRIGTFFTDDLTRAKHVARQTARVRGGKPVVLVAEVPEDCLVQDPYQMGKAGNWIYYATCEAKLVEKLR